MVGGGGVSECSNIFSAKTIARVFYFFEMELCFPFDEIPFAFLVLSFRTTCQVCVFEKNVFSKYEIWSILEGWKENNLYFFAKKFFMFLRKLNLVLAFFLSQREPPLQIVKVVTGRWFVACRLYYPWSNRVIVL